MTNPRPRAPAARPTSYRHRRESWCRWRRVVDEALTDLVHREPFELVSVIRPRCSRRRHRQAGQSGQRAAAKLLRALRGNVDEKKSTLEGIARPAARRARLMGFRRRSPCPTGYRKIPAGCACLRPFRSLGGIRRVFDELDRTTRRRGRMLSAARPSMSWTTPSSWLSISPEYGRWGSGARQGGRARGRRREAGADLPPRRMLARFHLAERGIRPLRAR